MANKTIYQQEQDIIRKAENVLEDQKYENNELRGPYNELVADYKKLFKTFNKVVKLNDKQQHQLFEFQRSILQINEELRQLNATKDKFFSIISHDLKSPINSFLNVASLLIDHIDRYSREEIQDMALNVKSSGHNLLKLLENLLHWSRMQMEHVEVTPEICVVKPLVDSVMSVISSRARVKNIEIRSHIDESAVIYADPNMISSVLQNLISNAIKFTRENGRIEIDLKPAGEFAAIAITDNGVGISERNLAKLFRIDVIYTGIGTNSERGTGLGLILCKEMVEKHNGKIWVESELKKGSVFTFTCPITPDAFNQV